MVKKIFKIILLIFIISVNINAEQMSEEMEKALISNDITKVKEYMKAGIDINNVTNYWGSTALMIAAAYEHIELIEYLLNQGADINALNKSETALFHAIHQNRNKTAKLLIKKGAELNIKNKNNRTPLILACLYNQTDIIKVLLENGALVEKEDGLRALVYSVQKENYEAVKLLVKYGKNINYDEALFSAVMSNDINIVKLLIKKVDNIKVKNQNGANLLTYSMINGSNSEIMKYLYKLGVPIQSNVLYDDVNLTALMYYSALGLYDEASQYIVKNKNKINYIIPYNPYHFENYSAMNFAIKFGHGHIVKLLLRNGAQIGSVLTALKYDRFEIAVYLINKGADPNETVDFGRSGSVTPLSNAIEKNKFDIFKLLIEKGADINTIDSIKNPLLHAIILGRYEMVNYLINNGVRLDEKDFVFKHRNPLIVAVENGNIDIFKLLLNIKNKDIIKNYRGKALLIAVDTDNIDIVKYLINNFPETVSAKGESALLNASSKGFINIVKLLISAGIDLNGNTAVKALIIAAQNNHFDVVKILLDNKVSVKNAGYELIKHTKNHKRSDMIKLYIKNGFDPNTLNNQYSSDGKNFPMILDFIYADDYDTVDFLLNNGVDVNEILPNNRPLVFSVNTKNGLKMLKIFIKNKVDLNSVDTDNHSLLERYTYSRNTEAVKLLLDNKADMNHQNNEGQTALIIAVLTNYSNYPNEKIIKLLVKYGADLNIKDNKGNTVLMYSAESYNTDITKLLIENGADINNVNLENKNVLSYVLERRNQIILRKLISMGIDLNKNGDVILLDAVKSQDIEFIKIIIENINVNIIDKDGNTALMNTVDLDNIAGNTKKQVIDLLATNGADFNIQNNKGRTALMISVLAERFGTMSQILNYGVDINLTDNSGKSALIHALNNKNSSIVEELLEKGADVNIKDNTGRSVLIYAVMSYINGKKRIIEKILVNGADVNDEDNSGKTAFYYARKLKNKEIMSLLRKYK